METLIVNTPNKKYPIYFDSSFESLPIKVAELVDNISKICIITDDNVDSLYGKQVEDLFKNHFSNVCRIAFKHGEKSKNLDTISDFYSFMIDNKLDRKSLIVALGGGVAGDMAGFTAATYMRGIRFIQVPTTLLSQVDSSVGGKTGVDFKGYKNIIGSFAQPELVYINLNSLDTLPSREFNAGMAEVIKYGVALDSDFYRYIEENKELIKKLNKTVLEKIIYKSCDIKRKIVEEDEKENGSRALLNFGHTIGHAIERLKEFELLHGECISIGFISAFIISIEMGMDKNNNIQKLENILSYFELPLKVRGLTVQDIYNQLFYDKKTSSDTIKLALLKESGTSYISDKATRDTIEKGIKAIIEYEY